MNEKKQRSRCESPSEKRTFGCKSRNAFRIFAQWTSELSGSAWSFIGAVLLIIVWALSYPFFMQMQDGFNTWQLVINTLTTIITFLMVFLIQNTQNRDAKVLHLKLDELIRSQHGARNELVDLEKLSDDELKKLEKQFEHLRKNVPKGSTAVVKIEEILEAEEEAELAETAAESAKQHARAAEKHVEAAVREK